MNRPLFKQLLWRSGGVSRDVFQCLMCARDFPTEQGILAHLGIHEERIRLERTGVSCILISNRPDLLPFAIRSWASQSWLQRELIIVLDSEEQRDLVPSHPDIHVIMAPPDRLSIGAKRNLACREAAGELIAHWDDDDIRTPFYLENLIRGFQARRSLLGGYPTPLFQDEKRLWSFRSQSPYLCGASLIYRRSLWEETPFREDVVVGEDWRFIAAAFPGDNLQSNPQIHLAPGPPQMVCRIHDRNTSPKRPEGAQEYSLVEGDPWALPQVEKISLGLLTWNTASHSLDALKALLKEGRNLRLLGYEVDIIVADNGSQDGTPHRLLEFLDQEPSVEGIQATILANKSNTGNSIARNQIIDHARTQGSKYLLFTDGDLEIIPWSVPSLISYLDCHPQDGCAGFHSGGQTRIREETTPLISSVFPLKEDRNQPVCWTQYGLFRMEIFKRVRFETRGPFGGPGWGFEDNDLFFQMQEGGIGVVCFQGVIYLHRNLHSSIGLLEQSGEDPAALYDQRQQFMLEKWKGRPIIKEKLHLLVDIVMPPQEKPC